MFCILWLLILSAKTNLISNPNFENVSFPCPVSSSFCSGPAISIAYPWSSSTSLITLVVNNQSTTVLPDALNFSVSLSNSDFSTYNLSQEVTLIPDETYLLAFTIGNTCSIESFYSISIPGVKESLNNILTPATHDIKKIEFVAKRSQTNLIWSVSSGCAPIIDNVSLFRKFDIKDNTGLSFSAFVGVLTICSLVLLGVLVFCCCCYFSKRRHFKEKKQYSKTVA